MELIFIALIIALLVICVLLRSQIKELEKEFISENEKYFQSMRVNFELINSQAGYIQQRLDKLEAIHKEELRKNLIENCTHKQLYTNGVCVTCGKYARNDFKAM